MAHQRLDLALLGQRVFSQVEDDALFVDVGAGVTQPAAPHAFLAILLPTEGARLGMLAAIVAFADGADGPADRADGFVADGANGAMLLAENMAALLHANLMGAAQRRLANGAAGRADAAALGVADATGDNAARAAATGRTGAQTVAAIRRLIGGVPFVVARAYG